LASGLLRPSRRVPVGIAERAGDHSMLFGVDPHPTMRKWHEHQDADERKRRSEFQEKFKLDYNAFRKLPLSAAQNISEHRTGAAPVTVKVSGRFGVVYDGSPTRPIPTSETREMPSGFGFLSTPPHTGSTNVDRLQHRRRTIVRDLSRLSRQRAGSRWSSASTRKRGARRERDHATTHRHVKLG